MAVEADRIFSQWEFSEELNIRSGVIYMRKPNRIFYNRLERIRDELNFYIESRLRQKDVIISASDANGVSVEKKNSNVLDKFLSGHWKLKDSAFDDYEDDFAADDEKCPLSKAEETKNDNKPVIQAQKYVAGTCQNSPKVQPNTSIRIPEFLRKDEKYLNLDKVLEKREETFSTMLLRLIDEKNLKDSDVYKRANIDRRLFSKIRGDEDYVPSKKTAISFCLALQLKMDEAKTLLATAGYTLSLSSRFDLIIMYLIENCEYNIHFANIVLTDYGEGTLSR